MTFPIMPIGAALGALSQSPLDNPIAGIAGGMIGYYAASKIDIRTPVKPYAQIIKSLKVTGNSNVNYNSALMDKLNTFSKLHGEKAGDHMFESALSTRLANLDLVYSQKYHTSLFGPQDSLALKMQTALTQLSTITNNSTQRSLLAAFGTESQLQAVSNIPNVQQQARKGVGRLTIDADTQAVDKLAAIKSHITSQLGHGLGEDEANRIIKSLTPAIEGMPEMKIELDDNLKFISPTGKRYEFPLQYLNDNGTRHGYSGNTPTISNSWNPFGHIYNAQINIPKQLEHLLDGKQGLPAADDVTRQFQPIEMLAMFDKTKNADIQLAEFASEMKPMFHHAPNFLADINDPMAMHISALTDVSFTYIPDGDNKTTGRLRQIGRKAQANGTASVFDSLMVKLGKNSSIGNVMSMNSNNDITSVSGTKAIDPSIAPDHARRHSTVTNRDFIMTDKHRAVIKKYTGLEYEGKNMAALSGFGNAREHSALLIDDQLSLAVSHIFGDKYTIDDGAGLFIDPQDFEERRMIDIDFPNIGTRDSPLYNMSDDMVRALAQDNGVINPKQALGLDNIGDMMHVGREYTDATIKGRYAFQDYLRVSAEARYVPDDWVKMFSETAKSGQTRFGKNLIRAQTNAKRLSMMQQLRDAGILTTQVTVKDGLEFRIKTANAEEIIIKHTANNLKTYKEIMNLTVKTHKETFGTNSVPRATVVLNRRDVGYKFIDDAINPKDPHTGKLTYEVPTLEGVKNAYMDQLFIENKAGRSAFINLIDRLETTQPAGYQDDLNFMHNYTQSGGYKEISKGGDAAKTAFTDRMKSIVDKSFTSIADFTNVKMLASQDVGPAIRGAGNEGSMSWLERLNLSMSGYSESDLSHMATWNKDALHELGMITSSVESGIDFNSVKLKYADVFGTIHNEMAPDRLKLLQPIISEAKGQFKTENNFISYQLTHAHMGYKSIPITFVETAHSRHISLDDQEVLSQLEVQRGKVIRADLELSRYQDVMSPGRKARMDIFKEEVEHLDRLIKRAGQGDNNIVKSALRGSMANSEIQIARSLGGEFGRHATLLQETGQAPIAAFNYNSISKIAAGYGLGMGDLEFLQQGDDFWKVMMKDSKGNKLPLPALMTREPAQGPGSSLLMDVYYHAQLPHHDAFVGLAQIIGKDKDGNSKTAKNVQALFSFGDFDSDTYKTAALGKGMSVPRMHELREKQRVALQKLGDLADFANAIALKGSDKNPIDVRSLANYEENAAQSSAKAIQRKMIAPEATDVATKMAESLELHLNALKGTLKPEDFAKRQFAARMAIHNLVENLLKTQHGESKDVGVKSLPMQRLSEQLKNIKNNDQLKANVMKVLDDSLGFNMGKKGTTDTTRQIYAQAKEDLATAISQHGYAVENRLGSLESNRKALHTNIQEFTKSIQGLVSNGLLPGIQNTSKEANVQSVMNKGRNMIEYVKNTAANNKKTLGIAGLALGAVAATMGSESVDLSKDSLPLKTSDAILPPIPTEKGYITKGRDYRKQQSHTVRGSATKPINRESVDRNIFNGKPKANITINDKRNQDIRNLQ